MEHPVKQISLDYGDARITFYIFDLKIPIPPTGGVPYLHSHCYYELHFLTGSDFVCSLKDREIKLAPHEFLILPPDLLHCTNKTIAKSVANKLCTISITIDKIPGTEGFYDTILSVLDQNILTPLPYPKHLEKNLSCLNQTALYKHFSGILQLKAAAAEFLSWLFDLLLREEIPVKQNIGNSMFLIDNMINRYNITLEEMAAATNYSKRHIARLIQQRYGCNLTQLRRQIKIQKLPEITKKEQL